MVIQDSMLETTRLGLDRPSAYEKGKCKMIVDPIIEEDDDSVPKYSIQTQIDLHIEEIHNFYDQEINFFDE